MKTSSGTQAIPAIVQYAQAEEPSDTSLLARAYSLAYPLLHGRALESGEDAFAHARGLAQILQLMGCAPAVCAAAYLVYAADHLAHPEEAIGQAFGATYADLVSHTRKLMQIQQAARQVQMEAADQLVQTERVRKMLLAFSHDLRVVLLRLASRLQTLRFHAETKTQPSPEVAYESLHVFAPLANRLGIWQIKWELEDLAFRFLQPQDYSAIARLLEATRMQREADVEHMRGHLSTQLQGSGLVADVQGRPKHIYSIWKKMRDKHLTFAQLFDIRAVRVLVPAVDACYDVLSHVHSLFSAVPGQFNDYIARPKPNGYQSLHTVVLDGAGRPFEVQIRTHEMHQHAEQGLAAHWAYKEAGAQARAGSGTTDTQAQLNEARKAVLRQLLAWQHDLVSAQSNVVDDKIYVFTPQAAVLELNAGATPIDFAYALHTNVGHRCRGAKVDGVLVPLSTPLQSGQTVEVSVAKEGGPSLDWINPQLGFLTSHRARAKVRAWFNAQAQAHTVTKGREAVEKLLQREGKTAVKLDNLASELGFVSADALFEAVGKDAFSVRNIETHLRGATVLQQEPDQPRLRSQGATPTGQVLVVGVSSLMTQLARCCRPAPPDLIGGFITRGKGVSVHRRSCSNWQEMHRRMPQRLIEVDWAPAMLHQGMVYSVEIGVQALDRQGLSRDITEVFSKGKINVVSIQTLALQASPDPRVLLIFTVEMSGVQHLTEYLQRVAQIPGVLSALRR